MRATFWRAVPLFALAMTYALPTEATATKRQDLPNGVWQFNYNRRGATGVYAGRCAAGERDYFELAITHVGPRICGWYETTMQIGNHVDDGYLNDWVFIPIDGKSFRVRYHMTGTFGDAIMKLQGNQLIWHTLSQYDDPKRGQLAISFAPPDRAVLERQPNKSENDSESCTVTIERIK